MTNKNEIEIEVIKMIKRVANSMGEDGSSVQKSTRLYEDLGFVKALRRELAKPLNIIILKHGGTKISKDKAGELKTVKDACDIVVKSTKSKK